MVFSLLTKKTFVKALLGSLALAPGAALAGKAGFDFDGVFHTSVWFGPEKGLEHGHGLDGFTHKTKATNPVIQKRVQCLKKAGHEVEMLTANPKGAKRFLKYHIYENKISSWRKVFKEVPHITKTPGSYKVGKIKETGVEEFYDDSSVVLNQIRKASFFRPGKQLGKKLKRVFRVFPLKNGGGHVRLVGRWSNREGKWQWCEALTKMPSKKFDLKKSDPSKPSKGLRISTIKALSEMC